MTNITLTGGTAQGEAVNTNHFGVNATFNFQPYSAFVNASQHMNLTTTRYPGGSETELYFDFTDPNRDFAVHPRGNQVNDAGEVGFNLIPMDRFLTHCVANTIQPTIVVPMTQLIATDRGFDAAQTQALTDFITSVLTQMGAVGVASFELGNEYQSQFSNNPDAEHFNSSAEYGDVSSAAALIIQQAIDDYNAANGYDDSFVEPRIEVQIWGYATNPAIDLVARNEAVFNEFEGDELAAIDGVASHYYYNSDLYGFGGIAGAVSDIATMMEHWQTNTAQDLSFAITEWNVNFRTTEYTGMRQVAPILELFTSFVANGIDTMDFWSMQYQNTSLASPTNNPTLIGEFMELLEGTTVGMTVLEIGTASANYDVHAFSDGDQAVVFVSSLILGGSQQLDLDFGAIFPQIDGVTATTLGYGGANIDGSYRDGNPSNIGRVWHDYDEPDAELTSTSFAISNYMDGDISFLLSSYEVMMLEFDLSSLAAINGSNTINGTHYSETINGQGQADSISGGGGNDIVHGNGGNDTLRGQSGIDVLYGDDGSDQIYGGTGNDWLLGGAGNDWLYGGTGIDNLRGNEGNDVLLGGNGNDNLRGFSGQDALYGGAGNDTLFGGGDADQLHGGDGNDAVYGENGNDALYGDNGSDLIEGGNGNDWLLGGNGVDRLHGGAGDDYLRGNDGDDVLYGDDGNDNMIGASGADILHGGTGADTIYGGTDSDRLYGDDDNDTLYGENGNDIIYGGIGVDWLLGGDGNDFLYGDFGVDYLRGEDGNDRLYGGDGADSLRGGLGDDLLYGEDGNDTIYGDAGNDYLRGHNDNDVLWGGAGTDDLEGGAGVDWLFGGTDDDEIHGGAGDDYLRGDDGNDDLYGGGGDDNLRGGDGVDFLYGSSGNDALFGDAGNDILRGASGNDILTGGNGNDRFVFDVVSGNDTITDFSVAGAERLDFHLIAAVGSMADLTISAIGGDTLISFSGGSVTLEGVAGGMAAGLLADDFIF